MKRTYIVLGIIIAVATFLRFFMLGVVPSSPNWDEVALGYNAWSIQQTGKDEYGKIYPLILRSYDDYKPGLYAYFVIPFISIYGLDAMAVRMPSALFGVLTVLAVFFLIRELCNQSNINTKLKIISTDTLALTVTFLLAISPWHIQFSRIAFESNVGLSFNVFGVMFFLIGIRKKWFLFLSAFLFAVNLYIYQSEKVFTPLLVAALIILFRKKVFSIKWKYLIIATLLGILVCLPLVGSTFLNQEVFARAKGVSVFSDTTEFLKDNAQRLIIDKQNKDYIGLVLDNRRILFVKAIISGYLSHFDLNWLFITGDLARHHAPSMGLLYFFEFPFLLIGIYMLIFNHDRFGLGKKSMFLIIAWFLIAPIPASVTSGVPHAVRTLNFLPTFQIFVALGLISVILYVKNKFLVLKVVVYGALIIAGIFNFVYYLDQYFVQQNYYTSQDWQYGYKEAVGYVQKNQDKYEKIIVSNKPHLDQSYMFFLFYLKYPPSQYQADAKYASGGFRENHQYGNYEFRPIEWEKEKKDKSTLYVGRPEDFPEGVEKLKTVNFLNGQPAILIVRPN